VIGDAVEQPCRVGNVQRIPPDVRNLEPVVLRKAGAGSRDRAEPVDVRRFVAAVEQPLQSKANAEKRNAISDSAANAFGPRSLKYSGCSEVPDSRYDDAARA